MFGNNGDMTEYAWYVWDLKDGYNAKPGTQRLEVLEDTPVHIRKPKKPKKAKDIFAPLIDEEMKAYENSKEAKLMEKNLKKALKQGKEDLKRAIHQPRMITATITHHVKL